MPACVVVVAAAADRLATGASGDVAAE